MLYDSEDKPVIEKFHVELDGCRIDSEIENEFSAQ